MSKEELNEFIAPDRGVRSGVRETVGGEAVEGLLGEALMANDHHRSKT
jgi:hypothetical protein